MSATYSPPTGAVDPTLEYLEGITANIKGSQSSVNRRSWLYTSGCDGPGLFVCPSGHTTNFHIDPSFTWTVVCQGKGDKYWFTAPATPANIRAIRILGLGGRDESRLENVFSKLEGLQVFKASEEDTFIHRPGLIHGVFTGSEVAIHVFFELYHRPTVARDVDQLLANFQEVRDAIKYPLSETSGDRFTSAIKDEALKTALRHYPPDFGAWENTIKDIFGSKLFISIGCGAYVLFTLSAITTQQSPMIRITSLPTADIVGSIAHVQ